MSDLNPNNLAFNFVMIPSDEDINGAIKEWPEFEDLDYEGFISNAARYGIGDVVTVYPDAARAYLADEEQSEEYHPDEKLVGLITKVAWCPRGLAEDADFSQVQDDERTYVYFMKRIDAPQDKKTKMLVAVEEDIRRHQQPKYEIGRFLQVPALGYHETDPNPDLRICKIAKVWWYHEEKRFHYQIVGANDPPGNIFGSGVEAQMLTEEHFAKYVQPTFNNRETVQIIADDSWTGADPRDDSKYQVAEVWWDMIREEFAYKVVKIQGPNQARTEEFVREKFLMSPRIDTESDTSS